jgi:hypothetical protein
VEALKPGQLLTRKQLGESGRMLSIPLLAQDPREAPLWVDVLYEYPWRDKVLTYAPRLPREHLQPIEDEL